MMEGNPTESPTSEELSSVCDSKSFSPSPPRGRDGHVPRLDMTLPLPDGSRDTNDEEQRSRGNKPRSLNEASSAVLSFRLNSVIAETLRAHSSITSLEDLDSTSAAHDRRLLYLPRFSTVSLMIAWALNVLGALFCMLLAETYQTSVDTPFLNFVLFLATHLGLLSAVMVYCMGRQQYGAAVYKLYQPFQGGRHFVILQFFGVFSMATSLLCSFIYTSTLHVEADVHRGVFTIIGFLGAFGNMLLFISTRYFVPETLLQGHHRAEGSISLATLRKSPHSETALVVLTAVFLFLPAFLAIQVPTLMFSMIVTILVAQISNGVLLHCFIGYMHTPGYSLFMVVMQRPVDTAVYWAVWTLYLASIAADVIILRADAATAAPSTVLTVVGLNVIGSLAFVLFLRTTSFQPAKVTIPLTLQEYGGIAISCVAGIAAAFSLLLSLYIQREATTFSETPEGTYAAQVLNICLILAQTFLLILSPLIHISGRIIHGKTFSMFILHQEYQSFVVIQGAGWLLYLCSVLSFLLFVVSWSVITSITACTTALLSIICITFSLKEFSTIRTLKGRRPRLSQVATPVDLHAAAPFPTTTEGGATPSGRSLLSCVVNGEMIMAYLMAAASLMLRIILVLEKKWLESEVPHTTVVIAAQLLYCGAVPLAHVSSRDKGVTIFRPFAGSGSFIALQVLGWTSFAFFVVLDVSSSVAAYHDTAPWVLQPVLREYPHLRLLQALLELIPLILITISVTVECRFALYRQRRRQLAKDSFESIRAALAELVAGTPNDETCRVIQLAFQILAEPSLRFYDLPCTPESLQLYTPPIHFAADSPPSSDDLADSPPRDDDEDYSQKRLQQEGASVIVVVLSVASATFYVVGAFFATLPMVSRVCATSGLLVATMGTAGIHAGYGFILHRHHYSVFIPFKGGADYLNNQVMGWAAYTCTFLVTLVVIVEPKGISTGAMVFAAITSVLGQIFILNSIPKFNWRHTKAPSFLEENGEAIVAVLTFVGSFTFGHTYELTASVVTGSGNRGLVSSTIGSAVLFGSSAQRSNVPLVLTVLSISVALPCILLALDRAARQWNAVAVKRNRSQTHFRQQRTASHPSVLATAVRNTLEVLMMMSAAVVPVSLVCVLFYFQHAALPLHLDYVAPVLLALALAIVAASVVPYFLHVGVPAIVLTLRCTAVTWLLYGLAIVTAILLFTPMLVYPRLSTYVSTFLTFVLSILGVYQPIRRLLRFSTCGFIGFRTYQEYVQLFGAGVQQSFTFGGFLIQSTCFVVDVAIMVGCMWYLRLYEGHPEFSGAQRSRWFIEFARRYIFSEVVRYFNLKIIVDDDSVHMRDPSKQYIFSFHPHGVFPGTALFCCLTEEWLRKVGSNSKHFISTHVASIIFNVPVIRDFNLRLGALSVSRRALESNLERGNSVCIVTGGQTEMLHTAISDKSFTVVTCHKGFIRLAMEKKISLVPLLSIGENNVMGMLKVLRMQRLTLKILGFPFPMVPYGAFFLPLPRRTRLTLVVGKPVPIPEGADPNNQEQVDALTQTYFAQLKTLFYTHRAEAGYPEMELILTERHPGPNKAKRQ